jgi:hypothetical protein
MEFFGTLSPTVDPGVAAHAISEVAARRPTILCNWSICSFKSDSLHLAEDLPRARQSFSYRIVGLAQKAYVASFRIFDPSSAVLRFWRSSSGCQQALDLPSSITHALGVAQLRLKFNCSSSRQ